MKNKHSIKKNRLMKVLTFFVMVQSFLVLAGVNGKALNIELDDMIVDREYIERKSAISDLK